MQLIFGLLLLIIGVTTVIMPIPAISQIVYPILWWGFLLVIDAVNFRRWQFSPMHSDSKKFWGIIIPLSVLYWLFFELANKFYPQWIYAGADFEIAARTFLTFISFATVIPAIVEIFWFFKGPILAAKYPDFIEDSRQSRSEKSTNIRKPAYLSAFIFGLLLALIPFFSDSLWLNWTMWLAPFFMLLSFVDKGVFIKNWPWITLAGLISGFVWEFFNFWAEGKWKYLVLPDAPHIFEMPILGYLGFIPFAFSTLAIYLFAQRFIKPNIFISGLLYLLAVIASFIFASYSQQI